ncbi:hypothetical protein BC360_00815 [Ensifer sp. LC163]|nr:hypothetical protein BC360_00815 [Ensifer sp. LC163]
MLIYIIPGEVRGEAAMPGHSLAVPTQERIRGAITGVSWRRGRMRRRSVKEDHIRRRGAMFEKNRTKPEQILSEGVAMRPEAG